MKKLLKRKLENSFLNCKIRNHYVLLGILNRMFDYCEIGVNDSYVIFFYLDKELICSFKFITNNGIITKII